MYSRVLGAPFSTTSFEIPGNPSSFRPPLPAMQAPFTIYGDDVTGVNGSNPSTWISGKKTLFLVELSYLGMIHFFFGGGMIPVCLMVWFGWIILGDDDMGTIWIYLSPDSGLNDGLFIEIPDPKHNIMWYWWWRVYPGTGGGRSKEEYLFCCLWILLTSGHS